MVNPGNLAELAPDSTLPFRVPIGFSKPMACTFGSRVEKYPFWRAVSKAFGVRERMWGFLANDPLLRWLVGPSARNFQVKRYRGESGSGCNADALGTTP